MKLVVEGARATACEPAVKARSRNGWARRSSGNSGRVHLSTGARRFTTRNCPLSALSSGKPQSCAAAEGVLIARSRRLVRSGLAEAQGCRAMCDDHLRRSYCRLLRLGLQ